MAIFKQRDEISLIIGRTDFQETMEEIVSDINRGGGRIADVTALIGTFDSVFEGYEIKFSIIGELVEKEVGDEY